MEEIEVGEYVRTKEGVIAKVLSDDGLFLDIDKRYFNKQYQSMRNFITHEQITNHNPNIIDLIEKDDYINGCRVYEVEEHGVTVYQQTEDGVIDYNWICRSDIKSIVTHQQFNSIKYEVE